MACIRETDLHYCNIISKFIKSTCFRHLRSVTDNFFDESAVVFCLSSLTSTVVTLELLPNMIYFQIALIVRFMIMTVIIQRVDCEMLPVRQTANGPVEGTIKTSSLGKQYYAFMGIPYAEVPITGKDPYSGEQVDRRFKVVSFQNYFKSLF